MAGGQGGEGGRGQTLDGGFREALRSFKFKFSTSEGAFSRICCTCPAARGCGRCFAGTMTVCRSQVTSRESNPGNPNLCRLLVPSAMSGSPSFLEKNRPQDERCTFRAGQLNHLDNFGVGLNERVGNCVRANGSTTCPVLVMQTNSIMTMTAVFVSRKAHTNYEKIIHMNSPATLIQ
jgi:hypothetical protein